MSRIRRCYERQKKRQTQITLQTISFFILFYFYDDIYNSRVLPDFVTRMIIIPFTFKEHIFWMTFSF